MTERLDTTDETVTNDQLKQALSDLGQSTSGNKDELQKRLADAYKVLDAAGDSTTVEPSGADSAQSAPGLQVDEGYTLVPDLSPETAKLLLEKAGDDNVADVRTTSDGFLVPDALAQKAFPKGIPGE